MKSYVVVLMMCFAWVVYAQVIPENETTDLGKLELKVADLEFQMGELEKQIQADSEKVETEKLLLEKYEKDFQTKQDEYFSVQEGISTEIELDLEKPYKNELKAGSNIGIMFDNAEKPLFRTDIVIPAIDYKYESYFTDILQLYFYSGLGYEAVRSVWDGEHRTDPADNLEHRTDTFSHNIFMYMDPMAKLYLTDDLFITGALPFSYSEFTPQRYEAAAYGIFQFDFYSEFGFDNRTIEKHQLSPWDNFEEGMTVFGIFRSGLIASVGGESTEDLPVYLGVEGAYSKMLSNDDMIKAYFTHSYQLNEDAGFKNTWITLGAIYAKDFSREINIESGLKITVDEREISDKYDPADPDDDIGTYWSADLESKFHYYLIPSLDIFGGINAGFDLSRGDEQLGDYLGSANLGLEAGFIYKIQRKR